MGIRIIRSFVERIGGEADWPWRQKQGTRFRCFSPDDITSVCRNAAAKALEKVFPGPAKRR